MKTKKWLLKNILLFLIGYCLYLAIEVTYRGYTYRLMGIVGGLALIVLSSLSSSVMKGYQLPLQMLVGALIITSFELISGVFALFVLDIRMWDYSNQWMSSFGNLICPLYTLFWFFLSGLGILFTDTWDYYVMWGDRRPEYRIFRWNLVLPERHDLRDNTRMRE
ncbi:MAG TPA: hypothetical protein IAC62_08875 [Candidatus Pelethocola excrementipullorum]|nr:hypothetical protein [Candidatus Pelethocola excrementipullorum]